MASRRQVRATDQVNAMRLNFPLPFVWMILVSSMTAGGAVWATQAGLRSDIRDIRTRMEEQAKISEANAKLQESRAASDAALQAERANTLKAAVDDMKRRQELQQFEIQALKEAILKGSK